MYASRRYDYCRTRNIRSTLRAPPSNRSQLRASAGAALGRLHAAFAAGPSVLSTRERLGRLHALAPSLVSFSGLAHVALERLFVGSLVTADDCSVRPYAAPALPTRTCTRTRSLLQPSDSGRRTSDLSDLSRAGVMLSRMKRMFLFGTPHLD
jgi:hypothetical protein